jgi:hypothetical protein
MNRPGYRDTAACQENHTRFIKRIIQSETVWYLSCPNGTATCESNDFEDADVLLFWSDKAYAKRAKKSEFNEYEVSSMSLFDFLFRWLTGMTEDGLFAGTNWTGDLVGLEFDPEDLKNEIEDKMGKEMIGNYIEELKRQLDKQNSEKE